MKKVYLLLCILIISCNKNKTESVPEAGQVGNQYYEIVHKQAFDIEGLALPIDLKPKDQKLYIVDYENNNALIYNLASGIIKTIGREGSGPGEFRIPNCLTLADNSIIIANLNRKVCYFDYEGTLQKEFIIKMENREIGVLGGEISYYSDSIIILNDLSLEPDCKGKLLHIFTGDWEYIRSCYDLSPICEKTKFFGMGMFSHEILYNGHILVMQPYEYSVLEMNIEGDTLHQTNITCSHYRPTSKERYVNSYSDENDEKTRLESDYIFKFFCIDDSTLLVSIMKHQDSDFRNYVDIVSLKDGKVIYTYKTNEILLYYDNNKRELYFWDKEKTSPDKVSGVIDVYSLNRKTARP